MTHCRKCRQEIDILSDVCSEEICPMALPNSGTNERELTWSQYTNLDDPRERAALASHPNISKS